MLIRRTSYTLAILFSAAIGLSACGNDDNTEQTSQTDSEYIPLNIADSNQQQETLETDVTEAQAAPAPATGTAETAVTSRAEKTAPGAEVQATEQQTTKQAAKQDASATATSDANAEADSSESIGNVAATEEQAEKPSPDTAATETAASETAATETQAEAEAETAPSRTLLPILDAVTTEYACSEALDRARANVTELEKLDPTALDANFLDNWDERGMEVENVLGPVYLQTYVHPDKAMRDAGEACILKVTQFQNELYQNEKVYALVKAAETSNPAAKRLQTDLIHSFEDTGVALSEEKRQRAAEILQSIEERAQAFQRNLRENTGTISFTEAEVDGMPESWKKAAKRDGDGHYVVGYDYPQYRPFMRSATNADARRRYQIAFSNRGGEENLKLLDEIMQLRSELAALHGLDSYADLATRNRMVRNPETVHEFLAAVGQRVHEVERADLEKLRLLRAELDNKDLVKTKINRWDQQYYLEKLRQSEYNIDQEALRAYFPTKASFAWVMDVSSRLYGIRFEQVAAPVWHEDVQYFDTYDSATDELLGGIYLDPYPRDGKYKHAAAFGSRSGSTELKRLPISALVTNFDRDGLTHSEVETLFHEFGHVLHGVLSKTRYGAQSGTSVKRDFVEAPSQMFEAWAIDPKSLALLREHCSDCPQLTPELIKRLKAANNLGRGLFYSRQHLYASFDMALAGPKPGPAQAVWSAMEAKTPLGHTEGTEFPGTFGHIAGGYAAGYYGYMWSEVLALDMLSAFEDQLMNPELGKAYRDKILAQGGQKAPDELVSDFLGRPANPDAFFAEISGQSK